MPRTASRRQPLWPADWASRLSTAVACAMATDAAGPRGSGPELAVGNGGDDADPVKSLAAAASEIVDGLNEAATDVGDSSLEASPMS